MTAGEHYALAACDLSQVSDFEKIIAEHKIDPAIPTFLYAECVLSYIDADKVDELLQHVRKSFALAFVFDYEMYNPHDRFGQMMVKNFKERNCPLVGMEKYPLFEDQKKRYESAGFKSTEVLTMLQMYHPIL